MNLKTTIFLLLLTGAGAGGWYWLERTRHVQTASSPAVAFLESSLKPAKITRIEVARGKTPRFTLEKVGDEWSLLGSWPTRKVETAEWIAALTSLHTRFAPTPIRDDDLKPFGLDDNPLIIKVTVGDQTHTLRLGEEPGETNRFTRATYVRLDGLPEVIRLGPGLLATLDRPIEYFQQRRLFNAESVAKEENSKDKVDQLIASAVTVETPSEKFTLAKTGDDWLLKDVYRKKDKSWDLVASKDRVDPDRLKSLLTGVPDLWAEKFVERKDRGLDEMGLKEPEYTVTVTRPGAAALTLLIGKVSTRTSKIVLKQSPPSQFGPPQPPKPMEVTEEFRYAKLAKNDQIFEVKTDKLKDIAPDIDALRDPQLARFKTGAVTRLEMKHGNQDLVLVKDKDKWRFQKPTTETAETKPIEEVLDKLAGLQARGKEIIDAADLKSVGLEKPAGEIKITLEEGKDDKKKTRTLTYRLGTKEKEKGKLYVSIDGWPRVNQVGEELLKLAQRPALAYRNRRVLDLADLAKIEIQRDGETFTFEKKGADWKLAVPVAADVDTVKVGTLAAEIGKLEGSEFISDQPKQEELDKTFGLAKPKLTAKLYPKDAKKPPQTLALGNKRDGKPEYYARIDQGPIFTLKKELRDDLDRPSLSYRPLQILKLDPDAITDIAVKGEKGAYDLKKEPLGWKITQPFSAQAAGFEIEQSADALAGLKAEKFAAHQTKDLAAYGLDKPALSIRLTAKDGKPITLEIGKPVEKDGKSRYAKQSGGDAVFVVAEKVYAALDRAPLDWLDKTLVSLSTRAIERLRWQGAANFTLEQAKDNWQVVGSPAPTFKADDDAIGDTLRTWAVLRADKFAAYGPKIDWAKYGLDKPATTITLTMKADEKAKDKKPTEHTLELGAASGAGRYARFDKKDAVVLLDAKAIGNLARTHLDFVDPRVLKFDLEAVNSIQRQKAGGDFTLVKREDNWLFEKPGARDADNLTVGDLLEKTFRLRAKRIAAYPAKDLAPFGLDKPTAVVTLGLETGKHVIKIGSVVQDSEERFAQIDQQPTVVVLSAELSRHLTAPVLYFADRNVASFSSVDQAEFTRGARKIVFSHPEASWQVTAPIKTAAEDAALDDLVRLLQRLRADEIVAGKGADLKKYGLDQPTAQWRFKSGDSEKLHLLIGAPESVKPAARRYAKLAGGDNVFLLSSKLTAKLLEEYRSRKPWPELDAAKVEELTVFNPDKAFTLRKRDAAWSVLGDFEAQVQSSVVTDTLDALAALKALRYVADAKADLQLYGLTKPLWTIHVKTPTGQRTLLLGRHEDNSKRFYAAVPGSDAVFIIDEPNGARIARPLSAYLAAKKKQ